MDDMDRADELAQPLLDAKVREAHAKMLADNVPFIKGECDCCGNDSERLVACTHPKDGPVWACAQCRDKFKLTVRRN